MKLISLYAPFADYRALLHEILQPVMQMTGISTKIVYVVCETGRRSVGPESTVRTI